MAKSELMTIDEYFSNHSKNRMIDKVIKQWFVGINGPKYCVKSKKEWEVIVKDFFNETEIKTKEVR